MNNRARTFFNVASILSFLAISGCGGGGDQAQPQRAESQSAQDISKYNDLTAKASTSLTTARALAKDGACTTSGDCAKLKFWSRGCHPLNQELVYSTTSGNAPNIVASFENYTDLSTQALAVEPLSAPDTYESCVSSGLEIPPSCVAQVCQ